MWAGKKVGFKPISELSTINGVATDRQTCQTYAGTVHFSNNNNNFKKN